MHFTQSAPVYFNPRSPCGERRSADACTSDVYGFQSTLPVRGATSSSRRLRSSRCYFNPRSPCGERHDGASGGCMVRSISIHAPRAGSDLEKYGLLRLDAYFNPRSPCGERRRIAPFLHGLTLFQSTLPVRGATHSGGGIGGDIPISIHAPRAGSDQARRQDRPC